MSICKDCANKKEITDWIYEILYASLGDNGDQTEFLQSELKKKFNELGG